MQFRRPGNCVWEIVSFDTYAFPVNSVLPDPAINPPTVVPDLEPFPLDGLYQVQILEPIYLAQDDVADLQVLHFDRDDGAELP